MKTALSFAIAISCFAAPAMAGEVYCSGDADEYRMDWPSPSLMRITTPQGAKTFKDAGSSGTGMNGHVYVSEESGVQTVVFSTSIVMDTNGATPDERPLRILDDRVYWPCQ